MVLRAEAKMENDFFSTGGVPNVGIYLRFLAFLPRHQCVSMARLRDKLEGAIPIHMQAYPRLLAPM